VKERSQPWCGVLIMNPKSEKLKNGGNDETTGAESQRRRRKRDGGVKGHQFIMEKREAWENDGEVAREGGRRGVLGMSR